MAAQRKDRTVAESKYEAKYKNLSPAQQAFVNEKKVSATMKIDKWLSLLTKISKFDKRNDQRINRLFTLSIIFYVVTFLSIFSLAFFGGSAAYLIFGFAGIATALLIYKNKLQQNDVNDYLRLFFIPVLNVLKSKAGGEAKLSANLDFRNPRKALKPVIGKVRGRDMKMYSPKYAIAKLVMQDGATLEFVIADDIKDFSWRKRSASGKTKYKSKTKFVHYCFIKLTLPKSEYRLKHSPLAGITITEHNGDYLAKSKIKIKKVGQGHVLNVKEFLETMQAIYGQFEPLHPVSEPEPNQESSKSRATAGNVNGQDDYDDSFAMMAVPYLWYHSSFDDYDYDSFEYTDSGDYAMDDDAVTAFDS
ncbi:hypothetical protein [Fulvivirga sediminis]|uniref:DUF3137 domain-containing protein n=1 Tax=Fulvivirga sediminis TaxID=2803949 RepID=A0A937F6D5_9BACT|nr:hypothetical protein [Fulvivirga sediminis]MBL3657257.1 hypothetical protein [Fulvivirga sediminis]